MILLREIQTRDLDSLSRLAQIPGFINLPSDPKLLSGKIKRSIESFKKKPTEASDGKYIFVAEHVETGMVVGTSMIARQNGTPESPNFYFEVGKEEKFSESMNTGFIHGTLKLRYDTDGPSEIGGLVVDAEFRAAEEKIGRQISFLRFLFLGKNRPRFRKKLIAELLPPLNRDGQAPLWEAIGRRFTNMDYWVADRFSRKNKEFIFSLFPTGKVYTTFLEPEARDAIGKVGDLTKPVYHMLTKIGFKYHHQIDPFDGGPHLRAEIDQLAPIKKIQNYQYSSDRALVRHAPPEEGLLCKTEQKANQFRAIHVNGVQAGDKFVIADATRAQQTEELLEVKNADQVTFMPYY